MSFPFSSFLLSLFHTSANSVKSKQLTSLSLSLMPHYSTCCHSVREVSFSFDSSYETPYYTVVESNEMITWWYFVSKRAKVSSTMTKTIFIQNNAQFFNSIAQEQQLDWCTQACNTIDIQMGDKSNRGREKVLLLSETNQMFPSDGLWQ